MAKTSVIARNAKRKALNDKYRDKRTELKKIISDTNAEPDQVMEAFVALQKLPRNSSKIRLRSRCVLTGRGRGVLTRFGLCRNEFRRLAHEGQIVGVTKSSW
ncbi:MAG: 30S ribosomal protein S14 [Candidatus Sumerlaeia bacterium]|nr:30S ribosomal protein S14 [Candidatus Sumerlaeia bacterium]